MNTLFIKRASRVLKKLEGLDFAITGSMALYLNKKIDREIHDLDLITYDSRVLKVLDTFGERSDEVTLENHIRYFCYDNFYIDVFLVTNINDSITKNIENMQVKVCNHEPIFLNKLEFISKHPTHKSALKGLEDVIQYFTLSRDVRNN